MQPITLTINGDPVSGVAGDTILSVAKQAGIYIPTLCHLEGITDVAACRLCLVEVTGSKRLLPACSTPIAENMDVLTDTPELAQLRRILVELMLAEGNHVCSVCVANGFCELQELAAKLGVDHVRCSYMFPQRHIDASHKLYGIDYNRCVLCTRCVRACDEVEGAHMWDVAGRGPTTAIVADMHQPWGRAASCTSCGKCLQACPTGSLFRKGASVAELQHDLRSLERLISGRELLGQLR